MKVQLIAAVTSAMCASGVLAGEYQTVRISNVDKALAKYTAITNGMAKNKIQFVKHNLVWPDGETAALCVPKTGVRNQRLELPVEIKRAGRYSFWIRHWRSENMHTALEFLLRSPSTECVNYTLVDRIADMWTDKDAPERKFRSGKPAGWIWTKVEVGIEHPGRYVVNLARNTRYVQRGMNIGSNVFAVAECWVTDDPNADPSKAPLVESDIDPVNAVPPGFVAASSHKPHVMLNSSIEDSTKRPPNQFMECYSWFMDPVRYLKYGATDGLWCGAYEADQEISIQPEEADRPRERAHRSRPALGRHMGGILRFVPGASRHVLRDEQGEGREGPQEPSRRRQDMGVVDRLGAVWNVRLRPHELRRVPQAP